MLGSNLKIKINYNSSDDVFVCDLKAIEVINKNPDGSAKTIKIDYFDPFSAEGHKTLYLNDKDVFTNSIEISSLFNRPINNDNYKIWK